MSSLDKNPDTRTLPDGWITQYDHNYKAWFYVNTKANPPLSTWNHPLGSLPSPPPVQNQYVAPPHPPPSANSPPPYGSSPVPGPGGPYPPQGGYYNNQGRYPGYGEPAPYQQQPACGSSFADKSDKSGKGGLLGGLLGGKKHNGLGYGGFSSGYPGAGPKKSSGMGKLALAGGAGLLGGTLLGGAMSNTYDAGYGCDDYDDYGGGDFGDFGGD